jgi:hypothetical protein
MPYKDKKKQAEWYVQDKRMHPEKYALRYRTQQKKYRNVKGIGLIPREQYEEQFLLQNGKCAICEKDLILNSSDTHYDHDHLTGQLRELLCHNCNPGIGQFHESIAKLEKAIAYLRKHGKN